MADADSMFMFEIIVEELKSLINCKEFCIQSQFADIFCIHLDDPNEYEPYILKQPKKTKRKTKPRRSSRSSVTPKTKTGQSIMFANNVESLISSMKQYPMELSLWSKIIPDYKIGSTHIAWSPPYFDYLNKLHKKQDSVCVKGEYNIFDEFTSRRMAVIKLNIKLSYVKDKLTLDSQINKIPSQLTEGSSKVETIYKGEKMRSIMAELNAIQETHNKDNLSELDIVEADSKTCNRRLNSGILALVRSNLNLKNDRLSVVKSKSCSNIIQENKMLDYIFGGKPSGPFGNQVYCVGYFTVKKDSPKSVQSERASGKNTSQKNSPEKSKASSVNSDNQTDQSDQTPRREKYKLRICDANCLARKLQNLSGTLSTCSLDLPLEASHLISVKKCDYVDCDGKKWRPPRTPPDEAIYLDLGSPRDCCAVTEKLEEVVGGMTAKMKFGKEPCYCACECKFGFIKKTTFCNICGGYEKFGDEYQKVPAAELPFPCPIFHKLVDKSKIGTSGSDTKRDKKEAESKKEKKDAADVTKDRKETEGNETKKDKKKLSRQKSTVVDRKSFESIKDQSKKGKRRKKDSRFKFNYGYQAPQIGHSRCLLPCTGTLGAVPTRMGWLWNAENVPGMKVRQGWRPGAISKRLLKILNNARRETQPVEKTKRTKKTKKRIIDKPTLIICKRRGEYRVEMQVSPADSEVNIDHCSPLIYRISRDDNEERIERRLRKRQRLIKKAIDKVWVDPYHPEACEKTCLKAYKQAIGQYDSSPECNCSIEEQEEDGSCSCCTGEDYDSSDTSSLDLEWEIHFSPPIAYQS